MKILNADIDTFTPAGRYLFRNWALLAEFQLDIIRDSTRKGLAAAKARGRKGGRPKGLSQEAEEIAEMCEILWKNGWSATKIAAKQSISRTSVYKYLKYRGINI